MTSDIVTLAREFACKAHADTNHTYEGRPYSFHLAMVATIADDFKGSLKWDVGDIAVASAWVHDVIEDARQTYNDVVKALSGSSGGESCARHVADIAYLLTNDKGRTRAERASERYYMAIAADPLARFVKLCDRAANTCWNVYSGGKMLEKYREEWLKVKAYLSASNTAPVVEFIDGLLDGSVKPDSVVERASKMTEEMAVSYPPVGWPRQTYDDVWEWMCDDTRPFRLTTVESLLARFEGAIDPEIYREAGFSPLSASDRTKFFEQILKTFNGE